jgi:hypothetical protein
MEIIYHKDKYYLKSITGYREILATTDSSLKLYESETIAKSAGFSLNTDDICIPSIPQSFIDKYVSEYNKGNKIEEVMVEYEEYESCNPITGNTGNWYCGNIKLNPDNTINIQSIKDSWTRDEVISILIKREEYISNELTPFISIDEWIKNNL